MPLLSVAVGGILGVAGSLVTLLVQSKNEAKRHRIEVAYKIALNTRSEHMELIKENGGGIYPIDVYLVHSLALIDEMARGPLSPESFDRVNAQRDAARKFFDDSENSIDA